jgi:cytochrome c-type biogenesis protein CcmH
MLLWISFALLAAAVGTLLMRSPAQAGIISSDSPDVAVYRDQLDELASDAERGIIDTDQASAARTEIARRLLKQVAADAPTATPVKSAVQTDRILIGSAAAVPLLSLAFYLVLGSPSLPDRPLAVRLAEAPDPRLPTDMIAKVEARLREKPDDGQGWAVVAPVYLSQGRAPDAAIAYGKALSLLGETPDRLMGFAKSNILANNGTVNEPAQKALQRLVQLEPERIEAKYWLAVGDEQNGRSDVAAASYRSLLASGPADAPWRKPVEQRLAAITAQAGQPPSTAPSGITPPVLAPVGSDANRSIKGPTPAEFVAAAQKLAPEMREQMIGRMIGKAADAVKLNPSDFSAWSRLVTGYTALGKSAEAQTAFKQAQGALVKDQSALTELDALKKSLSLAE